jgi:hypothetical protein
MACSIAAASAFIQYKGLFAALWIADPSGLSFVTLSVFTLLSIFIGVLTYRLSGSEPGSQIFQENIKLLQSCWYASELLMALGMMGTLIGFMMMLGPGLAALHTAELAAAKTSIFGMASGMSTAVTTTLVGLITSQLAKLQLINIESSISDEK